MATTEQLLTKYEIDLDKIPNHIAIIMDGNGRWAKKRMMPRNFGHIEGQKTLKKTLINCVEIGVKVLTVYVFSTENWKRPDQEVSFLIKFLKQTIDDEIDELIQEGVRLKFFGDLSQFDQKLTGMIDKAESLTNINENIQLNIMLNYGGRREIIDAVHAFIESGEPAENLTEETLSNYMYTKSIPDPDILIRTGGDFRISNFLLWQAAYSEFFFLDVFWPQFNADELLKVIKQFQERDRRFGGLSD